MTLQKVLILGSGFVGSSLAVSLRTAGVQVFCTRRQGEDGAVQFVLEDEQTWKNLPGEVDGVVWTLQAKPLSQVQRLYDTYLRSVLDAKKPVIVYGSVGRYKVDEVHQWIDETTKYTITEGSREEGEDFLQEKGATVLVIAGIWGESKNGQSRQPKVWFEKGLIKNFDKFLNLANVDDIVKVTEEVIRRSSEFRGQVINISDGNPMQWRDIIKGFGLEVPEDKPAAASLTYISRRVQNNLLQSIMGKDYKFHKLMDAKE